jgi:tRNA pseudouridine55 synthase
MWTGIVNLDKPPGLSSARGVDVVKRLLPRGTKVGHAGTLDPFATGVLLVLVGKATKSCERMMDAAKQYEATIRFGSVTPTDDPESPAEPWQRRSGDAITPPDPTAVAEALRAFVGDILQTPPAYSALKVNGRRAYDLARRGAEVKLQPRPVKVYAIDLLDYAWPDLRVRIDCGRGTYIRSIARELGERLDVGGHLVALRRTAVGPFRAESAVTPDRLKADGIDRWISPDPTISPVGPTAPERGI